jgi:hypothetical protein
MLKKAGAGLVVSVAAIVAMSGTAWAGHCTNIQKDLHDPSKGVQVVINDTDGSIESANAGVQNRIKNGLIDPESGDGFHGHVGIDVDGDGKVDFMTYIVGPQDALPETAINNGSPDHGIVGLDTLFPS